MQFSGTTPLTVPSEIHLTFKDEAFNGCSSSVAVLLVDSHGKHKESYQLGVLETANAYKQINENGSLNLDGMYLAGFSLKEYRDLYGLKPSDRVEIKDFSARRTFFDSDKEIDFSQADFVGDGCHFDECVFGDGPLSFYHCIWHTTVSFEEARFGAGIANFQYAEFLGSQVKFNHVEFKAGDVQFINAVFGDTHVSFQEVMFGDGKVDFHYTKFGNGNISFDKSRFGGGEVSFKRVDFGHGKVDFRRVHFGDGVIDFTEAEFKSGKVIFRSSVFGEGDIRFVEVVSDSDFIFDKAEFGSGSLSFFGATARKLSFQICQLNNYVDLRLARAEKVDLRYTIVRDIIDMMPTDRYKVEVAEMNFSGMRNLGSLYIDWKENGVKRLVENQSETNDRQKSEQFLVLKESYNATGRYADEDRAYVWYKRYELKADLQFALSKKKSNAIWAYPTAFFKWLLFDKVGLYATEPLRVLFSVTVIYTLFSLLYLVLPYMADTYIDTGGGEVLAGMNEVTKAFYYSAITFLTIGYGEFYPVGIMRLFASLEGYVGVFLMGYFSVSFMRKVLR